MYQRQSPKYSHDLKDTTICQSPSSHSTQNSTFVGKDKEIQNCNSEQKTQISPKKEEEIAQSKKKIKSEGQESLYEQKRLFVLNWLRKYCAKCKLSRQASAMTQIMVDRFYAVSPYRSKETKSTLVCMIGICSKFWDKKIIFPKNLSYIFSISLQQLSRIQEEIISALDFDLNFQNYAKDLNYYLYEWGKVHPFNFFSDNKISYCLLCKSHALAQKIYERKIELTENDYQFVIKTILRDLNQNDVNQKLRKIFGKKNKPHNTKKLQEIWQEVAQLWKEKDFSIYELYTERNPKTSFEQLMIRYTLLE